MSIVPKYFEVNENGFLTTSPDGLEKFVQERINATLQSLIDEGPKTYKKHIVGSGKIGNTPTLKEAFDMGIDEAIAAYRRLIESKMKSDTKLIESKKGKK